MRQPLTYLVLLFVFTTGTVQITAGSVLHNFPEEPSTTVNKTEDNTDENEGDRDDESKELREGTVKIEADEDGTTVDTIDSNNFIRYSANVIQMNGDDWSELRERFRATGTNGFSFLHIGDSHLQADIATGEVRRLFQSDYGNGGRGLIIPFRLAGTNEPTDYRFTLSGNAKASKLMKRPWDTDMSFTGIGISPKDHAFSLGIENLGDNPDNFRFVRIYSTGEFNITDAKSQSGYGLNFTVDKNTEDGYTDVFIDRPVTGIVLSFYSPSTITFHGAMLSSEEPGIIYNVIGNNGATYSSYTIVDNFGKEITSLYPDLIILSMGTNEAFGKMSPEEFRSQVDRLVSDIRNNNPDSKILLTTPKECQRKITTGRKRKRRTSYSIVDNCRIFRDVILDYGKEKRIPVYDWYEIAGGEGASAQWLNHGLLSKDRVHNTRNGYMLFGELFHSALERSLQ